MTGEFLWARPTVFQNVVSKIDGGTGAVTVNEEVTFSRLNESHLVCPGSNGGKNWPAGAYSPLTEHDVHAHAEYVHDGNDHDGSARSIQGLWSHHGLFACRPAPAKWAPSWAISAEPADCVETGAASGRDVAGCHRRGTGIRG